MSDEAERADTRMMGIVHGALRRDLLRTHDALTAEPYPRGRQRQALGGAAVHPAARLRACLPAPGSGAMATGRPGRAG